MSNYKFRGQTEDGEWVVGSHLPTIYEDVDVITVSEMFNLDQKNYAVKKETVGQYIGICDTSTPPKEIYDGDIIEGKSGIRHLVKYDDDSAAFLAYKLPLNEFDNGCHIETDWVVKFGKKVVGNVFDNPELIKKEV